MKPRPLGYPSIGFMAVVLTYVSLAVLSAWGLKKPVLDRIWTLQHRLKVGDFESLTRAEEELLLTGLQEYPRLAEAWLEDKPLGILSAHEEGWLATPEAWILRSESALETPLLLDILSEKQHYPFDLVLTLASSPKPAFSKRIEVVKPGSLEVEVPSKTPGPQLIRLRLEGGKFFPDPTSIGIRVGERSAP